MKIRTILLPVDLSLPAKAAACQARMLAEHFGAHLTLLHVLSYPLAIPGAPEYGLTLGEWFTVRATQDTAQLKTFFEQELKDAPVEHVVLEGDPAKRIVEYTQSNDVDLIVMPAYGQGPFRRLLLGSVTAKILHDVECPVWTGVHREEAPCHETLGIQSIVCAVGMGPADQRTIDWAKDAAASFDARLFIVHVIAGEEPEDGEYLPDGLATGTADQVQAREERLKRLAGEQAKVIVTSGEIHKAVCMQAEQLGAGLMVIGRSPQSAIFGRLPTHAYAIVRDSPCPVVSV